MDVSLDPGACRQPVDRSERLCEKIQAALWWNRINRCKLSKVEYLRLIEKEDDNWVTVMFLKASGSLLTYEWWWMDSLCIAVLLAMLCAAFLKNTEFHSSRGLDAWTRDILWMHWCGFSSFLFFPLNYIFPTSDLGETTKHEGFGDHADLTGKRLKSSAVHQTLVTGFEERRRGWHSNSHSHLPDPRVWPHSPKICTLIENIYVVGLL